MLRGDAAFCGNQWSPFFFAPVDTSRRGKKPFSRWKCRAPAVVLEGEKSVRCDPGSEYYQHIPGIIYFEIRREGARETRAKTIR